MKAESRMDRIFREVLDFIESDDDKLRITMYSGESKRLEKYLATTNEHINVKMTESKKISSEKVVVTFEKV